ncbi:MAG TPA: hypothetical protein PKZ92_03780 [Candidatus Woesebacteria bacterium]|jgi:hypothetical protein|nr:hypothetical protein [Candidatus Shapirobacteria bacterium]HOR02348.1 hypothetical protein [Candidatus Woesebacteria bacterium]
MVKVEELYQVIGIVDALMRESIPDARIVVNLEKFPSGMKSKKDRTLFLETKKDSVEIWIEINKGFTEEEIIKIWGFLEKAGAEYLRTGDKPLLKWRWMPESEEE